MANKKEAVDIAAYVADRTTSDNALVNIRAIRAAALNAKEAIANAEADVKKAMTEAGGRLVVGNSLLEFTKGKQIRISTVAMA